MKKILVLFIALFIIPIKADLQYNQNTGCYYTTDNIPGINQYEYHMLVVDILGMLANYEQASNEIDAYIDETFGFEKGARTPVRDTNALKCIIIDSLMRLGTPAARQLLADLAKVNYLIK